MSETTLWRVDMSSSFEGHLSNVAFFCLASNSADARAQAEDDEDPEMGESLYGNWQSTEEATFQDILNFSDSPRFPIGKWAITEEAWDAFLDWKSENIDTETLSMF